MKLKSLTAGFILAASSTLAAPVDEPKDVINCNQDISKLSLSAIYEHSRAASVTVQTLQFYDKVNDNLYTVGEDGKANKIKATIVKPLPMPKQGLGSGVVIDRTQGFVTTAAHVTEGASLPYGKIRLVFGHIDTPQTITATIIEQDKKADIALLKYDPSLLKSEASCAVININGGAKVGDDVHVVGSPFGIAGSISFGKVTNDNVKRRGGEFIQTDAAINTGNSGGGVFNTKGEVVGFVSHIATPNGGNTGVGFAVAPKLAHSLSEKFVSAKLEKEEAARIAALPKPEIELGLR